MGRTKATVGALLAALLLTSAVVATASAPASAAPTTTTYIHSGAVLLEYQPLTIGAADLGIGVPLPVLKLQARLSTLPKPNVFGAGGIPSQTLTFSVGGVPVCTVATSATGKASCTLSLQDQLDAVLGKQVQVGFAGTPAYSPSSKTLPLIGPAMPPDPPPFPI
jgi:hypothetical protein